ETLVGGPFAPRVAGGEIAEPDAQPERDVTRDGAAHADLDVVRVRSKDEEVDRVEAGRAHPAMLSRSLTRRAVRTGRCRSAARFTTRGAAGRHPGAAARTTA